MPIIMLAKLAMENGSMSKDDAKKEFRRAILNLKMSLEILKYEPDGSFEKNIYHGAKGSVAPLESFISTLWVFENLLMDDWLNVILTLKLN